MKALSSAFALLLALLALLALPPASAQVDDGLATVRLDGRALFRIGATGELEARQRARLIERQLPAVLEVPEGIAQARVAPAGENGEARQISVAGRTLMQVFEDDAQRVRIRVIRALRDAAVALPDPGASTVRLLDDPPEQS